MIAKKFAAMSQTVKQTKRAAAVRPRFTKSLRFICVSLFIEVIMHPIAYNVTLFLIPIWNKNQPLA